MMLVSASDTKEQRPHDAVRTLPARARPRGRDLQQFPNPRCLPNALDTAIRSTARLGCHQFQLMILTLFSFVPFAFFRAFPPPLAASRASYGEVSP